MPARIKRKPVRPALWTKCPRCGEISYKKSLQRSLKVCPVCSYHFPLTARERVDLLVDAGSFREIAKKMHPLDPLRFTEPVKTFRTASTTSGVVTRRHNYLIFCLCQELHKIEGLPLHLWVNLSPLSKVHPNL